MVNTLLYSVYDYNNSKDYILFIHGLGANSSEFFRNVRELGKHYKCIVFDLNGYGRSIDIDKPLTIEQAVEDVREFMKFRSIKKAHVVGHSMGGMIAIELAIKYPEMVNKLVIVDSCANIWENAIDYAKLAFLVKRIRFFVVNPNIFKDIELWEFLFKLYKANAVEIRWYINTLKYAISIMKWNRVKDLAEIKSKTLVVRGKYDHLIYREATNTLLKGVNKAICYEIGRAEHSPNVSHYNEFNRSVLVFLQKF